MRLFLFLVIFAPLASGQSSAPDVDLLLRPDAIHVQSVGGDLVPMERTFFHIVVHNISKQPLDIQWVRFDMVNANGVVVSGQYSGNALIDMFDSAIDRKRIEPTRKETLTIDPDQRKAISDIFLDFPMGFIGDALLVQVEYKAGGKTGFHKVSTKLNRVPGFSGRLPFQDVWYVVNEHGFLDPHKRFRSELYAYDFLQIGANGKSYQMDGSQNEHYYAYGKKVLAAKGGTVLFVRSDVPENNPGEPGGDPNLEVPSGNLVIVDHGNGQYGYYGRLRTNSIVVRQGDPVVAGSVIGEVGNSGDSYEPHLHFHVMNHPNPAEAEGIPLVFEQWKAQSYGRNPSPRQQGILPKGEFVQP